MAAQALSTRAKSAQQASLLEIVDKIYHGAGCVENGLGVARLLEMFGATDEGGMQEAEIESLGALIKIVSTGLEQINSAYADLAAQLDEQRDRRDAARAS